jgi:two-component system, response regulator YesN
MAIKKALLVEDDSKIRMLFKRLLEKKFRLDVSEAEDGQEGLEVYKKIGPDIIFLDIGMPRMNGVEFLTVLRQTDAITPVVVLTSFNSKEFVEKMLELGITAFIIKTDFVVSLEERVYEIFQKITSPIF